MAPKHDPRQNRLLAMLPKDEYERLRPHLERVDLTLGDSLAESGCGSCRGIFFKMSGECLYRVCISR